MSKNIILCSDGTGQKGNYGSDSNVYKLYRMIDLHSNVEQITFYDNGVGTSDSDSDSKSNSVLRMVSSAFGFGFQDNVCDLYRFLARHYESGDQIYFFGFGRGAATVRACVGFIHHCGLLNKNHAELQTDAAFEARIQDAMQCYQQWQTSDKENEFKKKWAVQDEKYAPQGDLKIHFIGVWDSVSALGFPKDIPFLSKLFDPMDKRQSGFYDFELNKQVEYAYQALAIDDARQTFHPLIWDESRGNVVEQVWFSGAHSNVGGGYPRSELSDVAFDWMLERAEQHGLKFVANERQSIKAHANPHGKLYNSRNGVAVYYRYQPRNLAQLLADANHLPSKTKIHISAIERLKYRTANYTPSYIPSEFDIVDTTLDANNHYSTLIKSVNIAQNDNWQKAWDEMDSWIKRRAALYYTCTVSLLILLLTSVICWWFPNLFPNLTPYLASADPTIKVFFLWQWIYDFTTYITPVMFENFLTFIIKVYPILFIGLAAAFYMINSTRKTILKNLQSALENARNLLVDAAK